jgi:hypothetical protein
MNPATIETESPAIGHESENTSQSGRVYGNPTLRKPEKHSLFHAHVSFDGTCKGYERHMRRGSAVRSVYGYLLAILEKYPNPLGYVFPGKRRIQENTFKWKLNRQRKWWKSSENYSRRQIYRALKELEQIIAIIPTEGGWIIQRHDSWTKKELCVCRLRHLENAPTLPKNRPNQVSVLDTAVEAFSRLKKRRPG